eukprot:6320038-Ditylum_brightwellii.AAC.1
MSIIEKTKEEKEVLATEKGVDGLKKSTSSSTLASSSVSGANNEKVSDTSSDSVLSLAAVSSNAASKSYSQNKSKEALDAFSEDMTELVDEINQ